MLKLHCIGWTVGDNHRYQSETINVLINTRFVVLASRTNI